MISQFKISFGIYDKDSISQAIEDFSDVSEILMSGDILEISGVSEEEIQETFGEFMNYVLSL